VYVSVNLEKFVKKKLRNKFKCSKFLVLRKEQEIELVGKKRTQKN